MLFFESKYLKQKINDKINKSHFLLGLTLKNMESNILLEELEFEKLPIDSDNIRFDFLHCSHQFTSDLYVVATVMHRKLEFYSVKPSGMQPEMFCSRVEHTQRSDLSSLG